MNKTRLEEYLGQYNGCVYRFDNFDRYNHEGIHTFSIVKDRRNNVYYGYSGPPSHGTVSLWRSDDLYQWEQAEKPLYAKKGIRWATAVKTGNKHDVLVQQRNGIINRGVNKLVGRSSLCPSGYWRIDWYEKSCGSLNFKETLIDGRSNSLDLSSNPYLTETDNGILLAYFGKKKDESLIVVRQSESVSGLSKADDCIIKRSSSLLAAPSLIKHPSTGQYILLAEEIDESTGKWITTMSVHNNIGTTSDSVENTVVFSEDVACPFFFREDEENHIYLFVSKRVSKGGRSMLSGQWLGLLYEFNAEKIGVDE